MTLPPSFIQWRLESGDLHCLLGGDDGGPRSGAICAAKRSTAWSNCMTRAARIAVALRPCETGGLAIVYGHGLCTSSGNFAMLAAIRRASLRARRKLASSLARPICDLDFSRRP
jgi:hypothetical protein